VIADLVEEILGGLGKIIGRILIEFVFESIFYFIGYSTVKILTLGKYPTKNATDSHQDSIISGVGAVVVINIVAVFIWGRNRI
jgi:hypothetical protein